VHYPTVQDNRVQDNRVQDNRVRDRLSAPIGLQLLDLLSIRGATPLTDEELNLLVIQASSEVSPYRGDYAEHVAELRSRAPTLAPLAEWLPRRMPQWWADLDRAHQVWVGATPDPPSPDGMVVDLSPFNAVTPKPRRAFWTSTIVSTVVSPWLEHPERILSAGGIWAVAVSASARVLEIHSPAAWSALARAYPSTQAGLTDTVGAVDPPAGSTRLDPDWTKVAEDWDGVHMSVAGLLTAEDVLYETGGIWTELRGWNVESTVWFRWCFSRIESLDQDLG
jgi:hypothetical protein